MDCQGTGDMDRGDLRIDHLILFIGLTLTNVLILNVKGVLSSTDLGKLEVNKLGNSGVFPVYEMTLSAHHEP